MAIHPDPHIHVEARLGATGRTRDMLAATFGLVASLPAEVAAGCGARVPLAMTSPLPERVTCLPCREHAVDQHLLRADQVLSLGLGPDVAVEHRALARRFRGDDGP